jgi:hypothetical protein
MPLFGGIPRKLTETAYSIVSLSRPTINARFLIASQIPVLNW